MTLRRRRVIRFIVMFDVINQTTLKEAYKELYTAMGKSGLPPHIQWESTDEAYYEDGSEVDPDDLQKACLEYFEEQKLNSKKDLPREVT
jgi:hypothetical protein